MSLSSNNYSISADKSMLNIDMIHEFLTNSYWAKGRSRQAVEKAINSSLCFGVYLGKEQVGFARLITDYVAFAYLADVFILESYRGIGLGKKLVGTILAHPDLQNIRRWMLATRDAHGLYNQLGFDSLSQPEKYMEIINPNLGL